MDVKTTISMIATSLEFYLELFHNMINVLCNLGLNEIYVWFLFAAKKN